MYFITSGSRGPVVHKTRCQHPEAHGHVSCEVVRKHYGSTGVRPRLTWWGGGLEIMQIEWPLIGGQWVAS